uniref:Uncharacterized protein n=1 Tax=Rhizophora mucronata TaxID=61149 RepID=A0A2P2N006_RHIMU
MYCNNKYSAPYF